MLPTGISGIGKRKPLPDGKTLGEGLQGAGKVALLNFDVANSVQ